MNSILSILACGSMNLTGANLLLILFILAAMGASGVLALVNPVLLCTLNVSLKFRIVNFGLWSLYTVPWLILLLEGPDGIGNLIPSSIGTACSVATPFVVISHSAFLFWKRRISPWNCSVEKTETT
jgi:hypothetical protein